MNGAVTSTDVEYKKLGPEHKDQVIQKLIESFTFDEPTNQAVRLTQEESRACFVDFVLASLEDKCSFVCLERISQRVIAYRLNTIYGKQHKDTNKVPYSNNHLLVLDFLDFMSHKVEDFVENICTKKVLKFDVVHVDRSYRRLGIAEQLVKLSIAHARDLCFDLVLTTPTSYKSQLLFAKLNFQTLFEFPYRDYLVDGIPVFTSLPEEEILAKLMVMYLK